MSDQEHFEEVESPAGGWGFSQTSASLLLHEHVLAAKPIPTRLCRTDRDM